MAPSLQSGLSPKGLAFGELLKGAPELCEDRAIPLEHSGVGWAGVPPKGGLGVISAPHLLMRPQRQLALRPLRLCGLFSYSVRTCGELERVSTVLAFVTAHEQRDQHPSSRTAYSAGR